VKSRISPNGGQRVIKIKEIITGSMVNHVQYMTYEPIYDIILG